MKEFKYMWRLPHTSWEDDASFEHLKRFFDMEPEAADTIAFFLAEPTNAPYMSDDMLQRKLKIYEKRAEYFRSKGKIVGINVWPTFGEGSPNHTKGLPKMPDDFGLMVSMNGNKVFLACPADPVFLKHITDKYRKMALTHPDFIWVDDDTRFNYLGGDIFPCFCDNCLKVFDGGKWERTALIEALRKEENRELRLKWTEFNTARLENFCIEIRKAVDEIDASIDLPFMSTGQTHTTFSGNYVYRCTKALRSRALRPGHGFYRDNKPDEMFFKAMEVGRQSARAYDTVEEILWEEESHPCNYLQKSTSTRLHEALLMLTMGGTGIAFNHITGSATEHPLSLLEYKTEMNRLSKSKKKFKEYLEFSANLPTPTGIWPFDDHMLMAKKACKEGEDWFDEFGFNIAGVQEAYGIYKPDELGKYIIPLTPYAKTSFATALSGYLLDCLDDNELKEVFSKGVFLDADALSRLEQRGFAHLAGVTLGERVYCASEILTQDPINGDYKGARRICLDNSYEINVNDPDVRVLSTLENSYGIKFGPCMTLYKNSLGGVVVVSAFGAWNDLASPAKINQLTGITREMGAPVYAEYINPYDVSRVVAFVRTDGKKAAVTLINAFLDFSKPFTLHIKGDMKRARITDLANDCFEVDVTNNDGWISIPVGAIPPWRERIIYCE